MEPKLTFVEYNKALKENRLLGLKCRGCGTVNAPPSMTCRKCAGTDMETMQLTGKGVIQTFTVVRIPPEGREAEAPYIIVVVAMDEGPWLMGNLSTIEPDSATMELMGKRVTLSHKIFPGDKYSAGDAATPVFVLED